MHAIRVTDILTSGTVDHPLVYHVTFMRGRTECGVELTPMGKVVDRYDCTDDEIEQAREVLRAYQTLKRHGLFNKYCEYVPDSRWR